MSRRSRKDKGAQKQLPDLIRLQNGLCFWCKITIKCIRSIRRRDRLKETPFEITFRSGDLIITMAVASVDHIKPLGRGGNNGRCNLVAACKNCNQKRNILDQTRVKNGDRVFQEWLARKDQRNQNNGTKKTSRE